MPVIAAPRIYDQKMLFSVEVDNFASASFMSCSEIASEWGTIEHREGGSLLPTKNPGLLTHDDVTLTRGVARGDSDLYIWFRMVGEGQSNTGLDEPAFKKTIDVVQRDRAGNELKRYRLFNAWPKRFVAGDWDNSAEENVVESCTIVFDDWEKITG